MPDIIARSVAKGLRMTEQRRVVARVIAAADDHPDVEELYARAAAVDTRAAIADRRLQGCLRAPFAFVRWRQARRDDCRFYGTIRYIYTD